MRPGSDPERLLSEAQTGDPDWETVFEVVRAPMRRAARSAMLTMGVNDRSAVDDAFVLAFRRLQKYGLVGRRSLIGFARSVAYRAGQDTAKKMIRDREFAPEELVPDEIVDQHRRTPPVDATGRP